MNSLKSLNEKLQDALNLQGNEWLTQAKLQLRESDDALESTINKLVFLTASAKRKLGLTQLKGEIDSGINPDKHGQCSKIYLDHWSVSDAARVVMLTETLSSSPFSADELFQLCFRFSDSNEQASLLKGLSLLDLNDKSIEFIIDIARTNSLEIFSALIYKNPWPVNKFPVSAFNQLVLKSLFLNINIQYLEGLQAAKNKELGRMAADYVQERLDANREIPESIWLAVNADNLTETGLVAWESALQSTSSESKYQLALMACHWQTDLPIQLKKWL